MKKKERIERLERELMNVLQRIVVLEEEKDIKPLEQYKEDLREKEWKPTKGQLVKAWNDDPDDWCIAPYVEKVDYMVAGYIYQCGINLSLDNYKHISPIDSTTIEQLKERIK